MHPLRISILFQNECRRNYARAFATLKQMTETSAVEKKENSILVERRRDVMLIGINRRERKNSLDAATAERLHDAIDTFEHDKNVLSAVLYGVGGNFCTGYDLREIANLEKNEESDIPQFGALASRTGPFEKPIIAALSGYSLGIGFELALMCDMRVMEETALLGFSNRRFGIPILCGGTVRLPALIGFSRATELILTGRMISAVDAYTWGLANVCVPCGTALGQATQLAQSLAKFPQKTMLADRKSMHFGTYQAETLEEALQFEKNNASHLIFDEGIEGAKRFVDKGVGRHGKSRGIRDEDTSIRDLDKNLI